MRSSVLYNLLFSEMSPAFKSQTREEGDIEHSSLVIFFFPKYLFPPHDYQSNTGLFKIWKIKKRKVLKRESKSPTILLPEITSFIIWFHFISVLCKWMLPYVNVYMNIVICDILQAYITKYYTLNMVLFYCKNTLNMQKNGKNCIVNTNMYLPCRFWHEQFTNHLSFPSFPHPSLPSVPHFFHPLGLAWAMCLLS